MNWNAKPPIEIAKAMRPIRGHREVAKMMGISRSAVFYIEKAALEKVAKRMRKFITAFIFMTATVHAALVGAAPVATNKPKTAGGAFLTHPPAVHLDHFDALSMIESGDCDTCVGRNGEVSRYQIMPSIWNHWVANGSPTNRWLAWEVCDIVMRGRCSAFAARQGRPPTDFEWYLLWHRPARVLNPTQREADRAHRFANLCSK